MRWANQVSSHGSGAVSPTISTGVTVNGSMHFGSDPAANVQQSTSEYIQPVLADKQIPEILQGSNTQFSSSVRTRELSVDIWAFGAFITFIDSPV